MTSFYGYNVLKIDDKAIFYAHVQRLQPKALLFYANELDFARRIAAGFPDMVVIIRNWPDDNLYVKQSPKSWLDAHESQAADGLYLYTCNESGLSRENVQWHLELMDLAVQRGVHLVLLNPATGTWDTSDYPVLKPLLIKASQHKDLFIVGLHSYAGGVITSGIAGGYPDNAGVAPGQSGGRNLIPVANWPKRDEIMQMTTFHLGRHSWLINYCNANNIPLPRFALTETGFDYLGDIGAWLNTLDRGGYSSVNGYQTLKAQWFKWWGTGIFADAYVAQFQYAAKNLLNGLEFALLFCYGDDGNWANYNVANSGVSALLEVSAQSIPSTPFDYGAMQPAVIHIIDAKVTTLRLREMPLLDSAITQIRDSDAVLWSVNGARFGGYTWHKVTLVSNGKTGFMAELPDTYTVEIAPDAPPVDTLSDAHTLITSIRTLLDELEKMV